MWFRSAIVILVASVSALVFSVDQQGTVNVVLFDGVEVTESTQLDFGVVENQDGTCVMDSDGNLSGICSGTSTPASFVVSGTENSTVLISLSETTESGGVAFTPSLVGEPSRQLVDGEAEVDVIGELSLNDASSGQQDIDYTVTVNYQ